MTQLDGSRCIQSMWKMYVGMKFIYGDGGSCIIARFKDLTMLWAGLRKVERKLSCKSNAVYTWDLTMFDAFRFSFPSIMNAKIVADVCFAVLRHCSNFKFNDG